MTNSASIADQLKRRCDQKHTHQVLTDGRAAKAAYEGGGAGIHDQIVQNTLRACDSRLKVLTVERTATVSERRLRRGSEAAKVHSVCVRRFLFRAY